MIVGLFSAEEVAAGPAERVRGGGRIRIPDKDPEVMFDPTEALNSDWIMGVGDEVEFCRAAVSAGGWFAPGGEWR